MPYKICHFSSVHTPVDIRIFHKQCSSLAEVGYDVYYVVSNSEKNFDKGVNIINISKRTNNRLFRMTIHMAKVSLAAYKLKADIYHFHDPELIPTGIILSLLGKKVIYDVHEDLPKDILDKNWIPFKLNRLISYFAGLFECFSALFFKGIVVVTEDIFKRFPNNKTILLRNLPILTTIDNVQPQKLVKNKMAVIYSGGLTKIRGIKELIDSFEYLDNKAELWLLGSWESLKYQIECEQSKGFSNVKYFGNVKQEEVYSITKNADIGIVNFLPIANHITAMPNKPFEYMACGLPIIMSNFKFWKDNFSHCAIFVDPNNPKEIALKISILLNDHELRKKLGEAGRIFVKNNFSWESEREKLYTFYKKILK
jgi:glycosyltransferase involved in cell wall biosynthesis